jgi:hypothetical protein
MLIWVPTKAMVGFGILAWCWAVERGCALIEGETPSFITVHSAVCVTHPRQQRKFFTPNSGTGIYPHMEKQIPLPAKVKAQCSFTWNNTHRYSGGIRADMPAANPAAAARLKPDRHFSWTFRWSTEFFTQLKGQLVLSPYRIIVKLSHEWQNALESSRNTLVLFQVWCSTVSAVRNRLSVPGLLISPSQVDLQSCRRKVLGYMVHFLAAWEGRGLTGVSFKFWMSRLWYTALSVARVGHPGRQRHRWRRDAYMGPKGKRK